MCRTGGRPRAIAPGRGQPHRWRRGALASRVPVYGRGLRRTRRGPNGGPRAPVAGRDLNDDTLEWRQSPRALARGAGPPPPGSTRVLSNPRTGAQPPCSVLPLPPCGPPTCGGGWSPRFLRSPAVARSARRRGRFARLAQARARGGRARHAWVPLAARVGRALCARRPPGRHSGLFPLFSASCLRHTGALPCGGITAQG